MRKRTHLRGVVLGVIAHVLLAIALAYVGAEVTELASSAEGVANPLKTGPFEPFSVGWYATQPIVFVLGGMAGFATAHFAPARSWVAPSILAIGALLLALAGLPSSQSLLVLAAWLLLSPLGILLGAHTYMRTIERQ